MTNELRKAVETDEGAAQLLHNLRDLIQNAGWSKPCVIFPPIQVLGAVAPVVVDDLGHPFIDPAHISWIGDAGLAAPAEQGAYIFRVCDTPTGLTVDLVRPAFDP